MPIYEMCLECGHTYMLSPELAAALRSKGCKDDDERFAEPCLNCSNVPSEKRQMYRFWLGKVRSDVKFKL